MPTRQRVNGTHTPEQPAEDAAWVLHCRMQGVRPLGVARGALADELATVEVEDCAAAPVKAAKARARTARAEEAYMVVAMDEVGKGEELGSGGLYMRDAVTGIERRLIRRSNSSSEKNRTKSVFFRKPSEAS